MRLTLNNESLTFTRRGVWVQPVLSDGFFWSGSVAELLAVVVAHPELDIARALFRVRVDW